MSRSNDNSAVRTRITTNGIGRQHATPVSQVSQRSVDERLSTSRPTIKSNSSGFDISQRANATSSPRLNDRNVTIHDLNPIPAHPDGWRSWQEVSVWLSGIPVTISIHDLREHLRREGNIVYMEMFESTRGYGNDRGRVSFR